MESNDKIKVLIAEDESPAREFLISNISKIPELELSGIAKNGKEAFELISENDFNLIFLDVDMPYMSGIEVLEKFDDLPFVIFTTVYDEHAVKAFDLGAVDYLLKPYTFERFEKAVQRVLEQFSSDKANSKDYRTLGLFIKEAGNYYIIAFDDIIYLSSDKKHTKIFTWKRTFRTAEILGEVGKKVPDTFARIHRGYILNMKYLSHIQYFIGGKYVAYIKDKDETILPVGRKYTSALSSHFKK